MNQVHFVSDIFGDSDLFSKNTIQQKRETNAQHDAQ